MTPAGNRAERDCSKQFFIEVTFKKIDCHDLSFIFLIYFSQIITIYFFSVTYLLIETNQTDQLFSGLL